MKVVEIGRDRKAINASMRDVGQAIGVLDSVLVTILCVIIIFIFGKSPCPASDDKYLMVNSCFPEHVLRHHPCNSRYYATLTVVRLCSNYPGVSRFLHFPVRQAPLRRW